MYTLFYSTISYFSVNLQVMLDEGRYKSFMQNMHNIDWKENHFKYDAVSMLGHGFGAS